MAHRRTKDTSGFSPQQRHDIIIKTLSTLDKGPQCFQLRWREKTGEYLTGEILLKTPMFWFMKYKWSRQEIETLFFKARVVIDEKFDVALQQTFGGDPGPRWKGGGGVKTRNWNRIGDTDQKRSWHEADDEKKGKEDDYVDPSSNEYKFQYHPVDQPVHFRATGGVHGKGADPQKQGADGQSPWNPLSKPSSDGKGGSGPTMGTGTVPQGSGGADQVTLRSVPGIGLLDLHCILISLNCWLKRP